MSQRIIKFRAWDEESEEFFYSTDPFDERWFQFVEGELKAFAIHGTTVGFQEPPEPNCEELKPVEMWTGLTDRNGVEIFEGDILHSGKRNWEVVWSEPSFMMSWGNGDATIFIHEMVEIIGNIYENPELKEAPSF